MNVPRELRNSSCWWLSAPGLLLAAALASGAFAWWLIAFPILTLVDPQKHAGHFALVFTHMLGGTTMLALGAANLYVGATRRFFRLHKLIGYSYLVGGSIGAALSVVLALANAHGKNSAPFAVDISSASDVGIALASLGVAWLAAAAMAFRAARNRRFDSHQAWMIRSYVLVWSFVLCRLIGKVPALSDLGDGVAIVWLSWVGPLFVCELALQWTAGANNSPEPKPLRGSA